MKDLPRLWLIYNEEPLYIHKDRRSSSFKVVIRATQKDRDRIIELWELSPDPHFGITEDPLIDNPSLTDELVRLGAVPSTVHFGTYLTYVALKTGTATIQEMLGENGFLHELVHSLEGLEGHELPDNFIETAYLLETTIPGWPAIPMYGGEHA